MQIEQTQDKIPCLLYIFQQNSAMLRASLHQYLKLARIYYITLVIRTLS